MKIRDIYFKKGNYVVSAIVAALCIAVTTVYLLFPQTWESIAYSYPINHPWQICSGIFLHGSPELSTEATVGHLLFNLLLILPFGLLIEKAIGSKRFFIMFLILWAINAVAFFVIAMTTTPKGETAFSAGISGIAYAYEVVGLYVLYSLGRKDFKLLFKQVSFYCLIGIAVVMLLLICAAGLWSAVIHFIAIVCGVIFTIAFHKTIQAFFLSAVCTDTACEKTA
ncbi:MAG: rhomboid family intramembrane serine protease [Clostridia bacterium]|nr:rhomboid family intramembrane serine protease [Clostridia bacterium]